MPGIWCAEARDAAKPPVMRRIDHGHEAEDWQLFLVLKLTESREDVSHPHPRGEGGGWC